MKEIRSIIFVILVIGVLGAKQQTMEISSDSIKEVTKIENIRNGVVYSQELYILKKLDDKVLSSSDIIYYAFANGNRFNSKSKIMIKFKNKSINIKDIENRYNLKLKREMNSGDYLFENMGGNTLNIINSLLKDESDNIERVSPNMILNVKPM